VPLQKLQFRPGIVREATEYSNSGGWWDADKVRFRMGYPEKIGGWAPVTKESFLGTCRSLHEWSSLEFDRYIALGTELKAYILWGSNYYDITPIRTVIGPLVDPFETYLAPNQLKVHVPNHGPAGVRDFVRFSGVIDIDEDTPALDVWPAEMLNQEFQVVEVIDADYFVIVMPGNLAMTVTGIVGGGPNVSATFTIPSGLNDAVIGMGWGIPPWGGHAPLSTAPPVGWGIPFDPRLLSPLGGEVNQLRLWDFDNFGEDLVMNIRGAGIYYWHEVAGLTQPATPLDQEVMVGGVTFTPLEAPRWAAQVVVSPNDRHLIAMGCDEAGALARDPLLVRWSNAEDAYDWQPRRDNSAGGQRLNAGSYIIAGMRTRQEIIIWTDLGLWSMKYIGSPYIFGFDQVGEGISIIGPNAAINIGNMLFWMDRGIFYSYTGQVQELRSTVKDYVFHNLNYQQAYKVIAGHNHAFSEVMWYYPSAGSNEIDRYVIYNYIDQNWSIGQLQRTSWLDMGRANYPIATAHGKLYYHEYGDDADQDELPAWIESADIDADGGHKFLFMGRLIPDVEFRGNAETQQVGISILTRRHPNTAKKVRLRLMVTPHTKEQSIRVRARQISFRVESEHKGVGWRLGTVRTDMQPDGQK
jgi:hypothetical protein